MTRKTTKRTEKTTTTTDTPDGRAGDATSPHADPPSGATPSGNQSAAAGRQRVPDGNENQDPDATQPPDRATPDDDPPHHDDD